MPWHFKGAVGDSPIVCTGPGCKNGFIPCPVDHASQPLNEEWQGERFFRCEECDWLEPDEFGENDFETAGMITCPECSAGDRSDTYDGPCDFCHKKNRPAEERTFPDEVRELLKSKRYWYSSGTVHACQQCFTGKTLELRTEHAAELERRAYHRLHENDPVGTCDKCRRPDYLALTGPDLFVCFPCVAKTTGAAAAVPKQRKPETELAPPAYNVDPEDDDYDPEDGPQPGFYDDPEEAGYLRWWSGYEWVGDPVHPEHLADSVTT